MDLLTSSPISILCSSFFFVLFSFLDFDTLSPYLSSQAKRSIRKIMSCVNFVMTF
jgi:hypothetical protein